MDHQVTSSPHISPEISIKHNPRLNSGEIAQLWFTFINYSMLSCIMSYFEKVAQDPPVKELMSETRSRVQKRVEFVADAFNKEHIPLPMGFTDDDVNMLAPPLFSDDYLLFYLKNMIRVGMTMNSLNLNMSSRIDVHDFFTTTLESILRLDKKVTELMLSKGLTPRPPFSFISESVEHVHDKNFMKGFFGDKRPLLTIEVAHLYHNAVVNEIGRALLLAFRQVSPNKEVKDYFTKGMHLSDAIVDAVTKLARNDHLNFSYVRDGDVTASTIPPFSDKLMMYHVYLLNTIGAGMYGVSGAVSARNDVVALYGRFILEVGKYAKDGAKLMMKNDWLEEPPQVLNREELAGYNH